MLEYMEKYCENIRQDLDGTYVAVLKPEYAIDGLRVIKCDNATGDIKNDRWVTIRGTHVLIGRDGRIAAGAGGKLNGLKFGTWFNPKGKPKAMKLPKTWGSDAGRGVKRETLTQLGENGKTVKVKGKVAKLKIPKGTTIKNLMKSSDPAIKGTQAQLKRAINALNTSRHNKELNHQFTNKMFDAFESAPAGTKISLVGSHGREQTAVRTDRGYKVNGREVSVHSVVTAAQSGTAKIESYPKRQAFKFDATEPKRVSGSYNPSQLVDIRTPKDRSEYHHEPNDTLVKSMQYWKNPPTVAQRLRRKKALKAVQDYSNMDEQEYKGLIANRSSKSRQTNQRLEYYIAHQPRHKGTIHKAVDMSQADFDKYVSLMNKGSAFGANSVTTWSSNPRMTATKSDKPCNIIFTKKDGFSKSASINDFGDRNEGAVLVSKSQSMRIKRVLMAGEGFMQVEVEEV